jgi:hypothetical protein
MKGAIPLSIATVKDAAIEKIIELPKDEVAKVLIRIWIHPARRNTIYILKYSGFHKKR